MSCVRQSATSCVLSIFLILLCCHSERREICSSRAAPLPSLPTLLTQSAPAGSQSNQTHGTAARREYSDPQPPQLPLRAIATSNRRNPHTAMPDAPSSPDETLLRLPNEPAPSRSQTSTRHASQAPPASQSPSSRTVPHKTYGPSPLLPAALQAAHDQSRQRNQTS